MRKSFTVYCRALAFFYVLMFFAVKAVAAVNDYACTHVNQPVTVNVLDNDATGNLCISNIDIASPQHGAAVVRNKAVTYSPDFNYSGIDSFSYAIIDCNGNRADSAVVYMLVSKPLAREYVACPNAGMTMGFEPLNRVKYGWYAAPAGGSLIKSGNTMDVKTGSPVSFWVEPVYGGRMYFPRIRVNLEISRDCGRQNNSRATTSCANGTLLFKEDFGGNEVSDPKCKPTGIPEVSGYTYDTDLRSQGSYSICKTNAQPHNTWYIFRDHTYQGDPTRGYLIAFDASQQAGQFYRHRIDGLCSGLQVYFSAWLASLINNTTHADKANLIFRLEDTLGTVLKEFSTGDLPDATPSWQLYGFSFTIPQNVSSIVLKIINNGKGSIGNDFAMDDIEIRLCAPPINAQYPSSMNVCTGNSLRFSGKYVDDGTFGQNLHARWEYSSTGGLNDPWTPVSPTDSSANGAIEIIYKIDRAAMNHAGYYRMAVSSPAYIAGSNCRAMTPPVHLKVTPGGYFPSDIRVNVLPDQKIKISLSSYLDTLNYAYSVTWKASSHLSPKLADPVTGTIDASQMNFPDTHTYVCEFSSPCGTQPLKAYVHAVRADYDSRETVSICKDLPQNSSLNLNQILGLEIYSGQWDYIDDVDGVFKNNTVKLTSGRHAGAVIFDTQAAYAQATNPAYSYNGDSSRKQFKFEYHKGKTRKRVTLVVGSI